MIKRKYATAVSLGTSVILILIGLALHQQEAVLTKAIHICLECIGLG